MINKRVKFLVFSASYPYRGGISDSTHSLCNELIKKNLSTEVWTFSLLYPSLIFPGKTQYSNEKYHQSFVIRRLINTINPLNWIRTSLRVNNLNPEFLILRYWSPILCIPYFVIGIFLNKKIKFTPPFGPFGGEGVKSWCLIIPYFKVKNSIFPMLKRRYLSIS